MYDGASQSDPAPLQRAVGELRVSVKRSGAETALDGLRQAGCLKARFPRRLVPGWIDIVTLNTSGGIAGGDRLDMAFDIQAGARTTIAAQSAERFYRAMPNGAPSLVRSRLVVAGGAEAEWLPQHTILFDRCRMDRRLEVDVAADASFLGVETLVFGRAAMGERVREARIDDVVCVRRNGNLLLHDAIRLDGSIDDLLHRVAVGNGARALATVYNVSPAAALHLVAVRQVLAPLSLPAGVTSPKLARKPFAGCADGSIAQIEFGASAWNDMMIVRILGSDSASVRRAVISALGVLRASRPLPRVWLC